METTQEGSSWVAYASLPGGRRGPTAADAGLPGRWCGSVRDSLGGRADPGRLAPAPGIPGEAKLTPGGQSPLLTPSGRADPGERAGPRP